MRPCKRKQIAMEQIDLLSQPMTAPRPELTLPPSVPLLSVPSAAVPIASAASPWSVNDSRTGRLRQRVQHSDPAVTWEGMIVGTPDTHPWDCCAGMVLVAISERVERMAIAQLRLVGPC